MEEIKTKFCKRCSLDLPVNKFVKRDAEKGILQAWCTSCRNKRRDEISCRPEYANITSKVCNTCKEDKTLEHFCKTKNSRDGYSAKCKICERLASADYRKKYRQDNNKKYKEMGYTWKKNVILNAKARARTQNVPFDLTIEDIVVPEVCPVLGIPLFTSPKGMQPNSPNLDRIIPERGYVKGNVMVISNKANFLKRDETDPETFIKIAAYLKSHQKPVDTSAERAKLTVSQVT